MIPSGMWASQQGSELCPRWFESSLGSKKIEVRVLVREQNILSETS